MFNCFAIKICDKSDKIVGHPPKEASRIMKFLLNRGATITAEITSDYYRRSPLVQGGLEVPCKIKVMTPTYFNMNVLKKYEDLVKELYVEPKEILGTFVEIWLSAKLNPCEISELYLRKLKKKDKQFRIQRFSYFFYKM